MVTAIYWSFYCNYRPFYGFSIFDIDKFGKICRHHWKERLKISKLAKFESDLLKTNKDIPPQSGKILQIYVWCGAQTCPPPYKCL